jgi:hypothetical protein
VPSRIEALTECPFLPTQQAVTISTILFDWAVAIRPFRPLESSLGERTIRNMVMSDSPVCAGESNSPGTRWAGVGAAVRLKEDVFRLLKQDVDGLQPPPERKRQLLDPGGLVHRVQRAIKGYGKEAPTDRLAQFFEVAGEAVLDLRCQYDLTTPPTKGITVSPTASAAIGMTRKRDRKFQQRWRQGKTQERTVLLLAEYAGRSVNEIANLLSLPVKEVDRLLQDAEATLPPGRVSSPSDAVPRRGRGRKGHVLE